MPKKKEVESVAEDLLEQEKNLPKRGRKYVPKYVAADNDEDGTAEPAEEPKAKKGKPKKSREELQKYSTDGDLVDIWERRVLNPNHQESVPIRVTTPGMRLRWINLSNRGWFQRARYEQGWVPVEKRELVDEREIYGVSYTTEGFVCRGEKQSEMLMKIPTAVFQRIQRRQAELNLKSYQKLRQSMGSAGYQHFKSKYGGSAGDIAEESASNFVGSIKFGSERVSSDELLE